MATHKSVDHLAGKLLNTSRDPAVRSVAAAALSIPTRRLIRATAWRPSPAHYFTTGTKPSAAWQPRCSRTTNRRSARSAIGIL